VREKAFWFNQLTRLGLKPRRGHRVGAQPCGLRCPGPSDQATASAGRARWRWA